MTVEQELLQKWTNLGDMEFPITSSDVKKKNIIQDRGNMHFRKIALTIANDPDFQNRDDDNG
jgi:hypothetical protein